MVNDIDYEYGVYKRLRQNIHIVVCEESWDTVNDEGEYETKTSRHAWISNHAISLKNVHKRCNLMARSRWGLENDILKEKKQGYAYEHVFSYDWNALKGYHHLMHIGHLFNELVLHTEGCWDKVEELGIQGFIRFWRGSIDGFWLNLKHIRHYREKPHQLSSVC